MNVCHIQKTNTENNWNNSTTILQNGEIGYATDTGTLKLGDGINTWKNLNTSHTFIPKSQSSTTSVPTGNISSFAGTTAPAGYLICDGAAISRTTYSSLFSVIGTTYGSGDGSTTFNIPNYNNAKYVSGGTYSVSVYGNGKTIIVTNGSQKGAIRQGGSAINPCTASPTSLTIPASNSTSSQFSGNTLLGFSTDATQSGLTGSVTISATVSPKFIIKY